jgi:hypothetical protein
MRATPDELLLLAMLSSTDVKKAVHFGCVVLLQTAVDIDGHERHLSEFAGKVTLVVNVASQCGFTDANYKGAATNTCRTAHVDSGWAARCNTWPKYQAAYATTQGVSSATSRHQWDDHRVPDGVAAAAAAG